MAKRKVNRSNTKKTKKRLRPIHLLKSDLNKIFSTFIRMRDADAQGNIRCCTTGNVYPWQKSQCGHFFTRRGNPALVFEETNCNAQSPMANRLQRNNITWDYFLTMEKKWGRKEIDRLASLRKKPFKFTREWLTEKIAHYTKEVEKLKQQKNL